MRVRLHTVLLFLFGAAVAGCTAGQSTLADVARREEAAASPVLTPMEREAVLKGQIFAGMTEEMVAASWGVPQRTASSGPRGSTDRWEYAPRPEAPFGASLEFQQGVLVRLDRAESPGLLGAGGLELPPSAPPERIEIKTGLRQR